MFKCHSLKFISLPSSISFLSLFFSWVGIIILLNNQFYFSFAFILIAFILDSLDGFLARKLKQESDFGRQLDGHIDVFTYLLYPALSFYLFFGLRDTISLIVTFIFLVAGIFRLVRFNIKGYVKFSQKNFRAYSGLPVFFNHIPLLIFLCLRFFEIKYFNLVADAIILLNSFLMIQTFPFPKPRKILPFVMLLLLLSIIMFYLGVYEIR